MELLVHCEGLAKLGAPEGAVRASALVRAMEQRQRDLVQLVDYYLTRSNGAEPLNVQGRCHFCGARRVRLDMATDTIKEAEEHTAECLWWREVQLLSA